VIKVIGFLGSARYGPSIALIQGERINQRVFPLALIEYYVKKGERVEGIFALTEEAEKKFQDEVAPFLAELGNVKYRTIRVSENKTPSETIVDLIKGMTEVFEDGDEVIIDITHGFRWMPASALVISMFIKQVRKNVGIKIVYGNYKKESEITELCDISSLIEIADWIYSTRLFIEYGYGEELSRLIDTARERIYKNSTVKDKPRKLGALASRLLRVSYSLRIGSIKLLRESVHEFLKLFDSGETKEFTKIEIEKFVPHLNLLIDSIINTYKRFDSGRKDVLLDEKELKTERELISFYLKTGDIGMALRLCREYVINCYLFCYGKADKVFDLACREAAFLNAAKSSKINISIIRESRNHVAHFAFNKDNNPSEENVRNAIQAVIAEEDVCKLFNQKSEESKLAVLTPLGTTPGALYTILKHYTPDLVVVVTSEKGKSLIDEIVEKAEYKNRTEVIVIRDPFTGIDETKDVVEQATEYLEDVSDVIINLTGGTSLLGYMIERVRDRIRNGKRITTVLAADERPYQEQVQNPYVIGKVIEIEQTEC